MKAGISGLYFKIMNLRFLIGLLLAMPVAAIAQDAGIHTLNRDTIEMGEIIRGDTVQAVFRFQVTGTGRLKIKQVHPGCQCTVPVFPQDSLAAGTIDSIVLEFHSKNVHSGPVEKYAIVINSGPEKVFYLKGLIRDSVPGDRKTKKFTITNN